MSELARESSTRRELTSGSPTQRELARGSSTHPVLGVVRLQLVNPRFRFGLPLGILAIVVAVNLLLFAALDTVIPPDGRTTGAVVTLYIMIGTTFLGAMTQTFTFALGLSVTRRDYYLGVLLLAVLESLGYGLLVYVIGLAERATGGWGLDLQFFALEFLRVDNPVLQWLVYAVPFVAFAAVGIFLGVVFKRWGAVGVWAATLLPSVLAAAAVVLITWQGWWSAVGSWLADQSIGGLLAGYPLLLAVLLAGAAWLPLRRATP